FLITEMESDRDHIHLLIECKPQHYIPNIVKALKGVSARALFKKHPTLKTQLWRGHLWNPSYLIATVSEHKEEQHKIYIQHKMKKEEETVWIKEVDSIAIQSSLNNLADSYSRFFKNQNARPKFKSKKNPIQSYTTQFTNNNIAIVDNKLKLPKLGLVKVSQSRALKGRIINATISRRPSGKYFVSLL